MSLLSTPPVTPIEPPTLTALAWPLLIGAAIALVFDVAGPPSPVPIGAIAGGALAAGGVVGWLWRRSRARAAAISRPGALQP